MAITFYAGSGSPWVWRVWLALEHKALPYEVRMLSFSAGDTRKPEFVALNPRHRVPVIVDQDFVLYESNAIVEYLEDAYPGRGAPLFPAEVHARAVARRFISEIDSYTDKAFDLLLDPIFQQKPEERAPDAIEKGRAAVREELATVTRMMRGDYLAGPLSAADFALYPLVAFVYRARAARIPDFDADGLLTPELRAWKKRIESLPFFDRTVPPHWKAKG